MRDTQPDVEKMNGLPGIMEMNIIKDFITSLPGVGAKKMRAPPEAGILVSAG